MLGQQVAASMLITTGHWHAGIIGQFTGVAVGWQTGHFSTGQQVAGSSPTLTGGTPPGQAISTIGQATGPPCGTQVTVAGTHCATQVCPEQLPAESQLHAGLAAGQTQAVPEVRAEQPKPKQASLQLSPAGQSASDVQAEGAGSQVQGPPHGSVPAQTSASPGLQAGSVQPQGAAEAGGGEEVHGH